LVIIWECKAYHCTPLFPTLVSYQYNCVCTSDLWILFSWPILVHRLNSTLYNHISYHNFI
jgi:hypothetical protein